MVSNVVATFCLPARCAQAGVYAQAEALLLSLSPPGRACVARSVAVAPWRHNPQHGEEIASPPKYKSGGSQRHDKNMIDFVVVIFFGWPAVITSIMLSIAGLLLKKPKLLIAAGIVCVPFTYYISNGFRTPAMLLPLLQFSSVYVITRQGKLMGWLLIMPIIIVSAALAYTVLTQ